MKRRRSKSSYRRAALQGWETRRKGLRLNASREGQRKRELTERRQSPAARAKRTRAARAFAARQLQAKRAEAARKGWETRRRRHEAPPAPRVRKITSLSQLDKEELTETIDLETQPEGASWQPAAAVA